MSDDAQAPEEEEDDQAWLATFADLMSLLMCFFVLLLSFSEMDLEKYRQIAGSLRVAFGVQREIVAPDPPKGTSIIALEYRPGRPIPSPIRLMEQEGNEMSSERQDMIEAIQAELDTRVEELREVMAAEVESGHLEILAVDGEIIVRIRESKSFPSGSAHLHKSFHTILGRILDGLKDTPGRLLVAGHTDNVPISTRHYQSNWVLSSARAASVVHYLSTLERFHPDQIEIRAYADTRPLVDNNSAENRAKNRRVEIIVSHDEYVKAIKDYQRDLQNQPESAAAIGQPPATTPITLPTTFDTVENNSAVDKAIRLDPLESSTDPATAETAAIEKTTTDAPLSPTTSVVPAASTGASPALNTSISTNQSEPNSNEPQD